MPPLHIGRDAADLRNLLLRQPVIVRASTGERVALVAGEIDWGWIAELAAQAVDVDEGYAAGGAG